ncbi:MAG: fabF [Bacteroidetes bacterium]|nr:MAG: fabF [Bacteroidota bacterium]
MKVYISAAQAFSPHDTFLSEKLPGEVEVMQGVMKFRLPDFRLYFNPLQRRRMSNLVKVSSICSLECMNESGIKKPDAIIVASSLGSVEESEKFLNKLIDENAEFLTPTNFIQSNHNSLGAQIALNLECNNYNVVYSHKTASFESALIDACMLIEDGEAGHVLVGGIDEITNENYELKKSIGLWKSEPFTNLDILNSKSPGSIPGEGVAFFVLSSVEAEQSYARIDGVSLYPYSDSQDEVLEKMLAFLSDSGSGPEQIDLVLTGNNGDRDSDAFTIELLNSGFRQSIHGIYKHLSGEYDTAASFGLWFAARIMREGKIPGYARLNPVEREIGQILIYHHDGFRNHSFMLLQKCQSKAAR